MHPDLPGPGTKGTSNRRALIEYLLHRGLGNVIPSPVCWECQERLDPGSGLIGMTRDDRYKFLANIVRGPGLALPGLLSGHRIVKLCPGLPGVICMSG